MALKNKIDPQVAQQRLAEWLATRIPEAAQARVDEVVIPGSNGLSCETVLFDATWNGERRRLVARVAPHPDDDAMALFPNYDLELEAKIMTGLARHTSVPAPNVLLTETDADVLGGPFLIMDRIDGRVPPDDPPYSMSGWLLELELEQQRAIVDRTVEMLADLHAVDWRTLGLDDLDRSDRGPLGVAQYIGMAEYLYASGAGGKSYPTLDAAIAWAKDHAPEQEGPMVLNWGDTRIGNIMFGEDLSVEGVLDWEMACVATREQDLAYFLFNLDFFTTGLGAPSPPGFPSEDEIVRHYTERSGHEVQNLDYYKATAALLAAVLTMRVGNVMISHGLLPADSPMPDNNPASQTLARYMGLPAPAGAMGDWTGVR